MLTAVGSEPLVLGPQLRQVALQLGLRAPRQLVELRALQHLQQHCRHLTARGPHNAPTDHRSVTPTDNTGNL